MASHALERSLNNTKRALKIWNKLHFGNVQNNVQELEEKLNEAFLKDGYIREEQERLGRELKIQRAR